MSDEIEVIDVTEEDLSLLTANGLTGGGGNVTSDAPAQDQNFVQFDGETGRKIKDFGVSLDTDASMAANSDSKLPSQKAVKAALATKQNVIGYTPEDEANKDTDASMAANSDTKYPSQKAVKTALDTKQNSLGFTPEDVSNKDTDATLAANSDTKYPSQKAVKTYIDDAIAGLPDPGGNGDVTGPSSSVDEHFVMFDGTTGKAIKDTGLALSTDTSLASGSDEVIPTQKAVKAYADTKEPALGFTPEDVANKDTDGTFAANSDTKYPSQKAVKTYVDSQVAGTGTGDVHGPAVSVDSHLAQFDGTTGKIIKDGGLAVDTDGTLAANSDSKVPSQKAVKTYADTKQSALGFTPEDVVNKDTDGTLAANSDTKYASQKATKTYADTKVAGAGTVTADHVVQFDGTTGKAIKGGVALDTDGTLAANSDTRLATQKAVKTYVDANIGGGGSSPDIFKYWAAMMEPLAIEKIQTGSFSYSLAAGTPKILMASFNTKLGASGRMEARNPKNPFILNTGLTLAGLGSDAAAVIIDPSLPTYADAQDTYYDRLNDLAINLTQKIINLGSSDSQKFLPGPYGSLITHLTNFDNTWTGARPFGTSVGWNLWDEINDSDTQRLGDGVIIPLCKGIIDKLVTGSGGGVSSVVHVTLPSTWGKVTDSNTYTFRDDFMGTTLDTSTVWQRAQSTAGNIEIDTAWQWCKFNGNSNWGQNSIYSRTGKARANGVRMVVDFFTGSNNDVGMIGMHDGAGFSYTNIIHGLNFHLGSINAFEAGTDRGTVGSGFSTNTIYRLRFTIQASTSTCKYEIQGGTQYPAIGDSSWTDITPAVTSNSTTPIYVGAAAFAASGAYLSDFKITP